MNLIETRAAELRAQFIANAEEFGFSQEEIAAANDDSDGDDYFIYQAAAHLAAELRAHRRSLKATRPRKFATRSATRRARAKRPEKAVGAGYDEGRLRPAEINFSPASSLLSTLAVEPLIWKEPPRDDPSRCPLAALVKTLRTIEHAATISGVEAQASGGIGFRFGLVDALLSDTIDDIVFNVALKLRPRSRIGARLLATSIVQNSESIERDGYYQKYPKMRLKRQELISTASRALYYYGPIEGQLEIMNGEERDEAGFAEFETNPFWPLRREQVEMSKRRAA